MKPKIKVVNLREFNKQLEDLKGAARGEALKQAAMAGGQVIQAAARVNAEAQFTGNPEGTLKESIAVEVEKTTPNSAWVNIGPTVIYGRIQELGGWIEATTAKALSWINEEGKRVFAKKVHLDPRPYLRPAFDENQDKAVKAIGASIKASIEKALKGKG